MKREKLLQFAHLMAGSITLLYGFDTLEAGDFSSAAYYLSISIIFMIVAGSHKWIAQKFMKADVAFFLVEAATILYTGWHYKMQGHPYFFYTMAAAGLLYFSFAILSLLSEQKPRRRSRKRRRRSSLFQENSEQKNSLQ